MKEIKAIIQPFMLERVLDALCAFEGLPGVTISQVQGWGRTHTPSDMEGGHTFANKTKIEIVVNDDQSAAIVAAIVLAAKTGHVGDGKVFILDVADVVKISTGERGT